MNKQELIDYCNAIKENKSQIINCIDVNGIIKKIEQLDEPEKVRIPRFVADWVSYNKGWNQTLQYALANASDKVLSWLCEDKLNRQNIFAHAWLHGYILEKENRYLVKFKGLNPNYIFLKFHQYDNDKTWFVGREQEYEFFRIHHTRKELEEAGFGWVFDCEGIEVEEMKE